MGRVKSPRSKSPKVPRKKKKNVALRVRSAGDDEEENADEPNVGLLTSLTKTTGVLPAATGVGNTNTPNSADEKKVAPPIPEDVGDTEKRKKRMSVKPEIKELDV